MKEDIKFYQTEDENILESSTGIKILAVNENYIKEEESSIAKVRNRLSPIVNYFAMRKMIEEEDLILPENKAYFQSLIDLEYDNIQTKNMDELLELIKDDNIW